MAHDYHQGQPGYSAGQLLIDGCGECAERGQRPELYLAHVDNAHWQRAWARAVDYGRGRLDDCSAAELPVLHLLWQLAIVIERAGIPGALIDWLMSQSPAELRLGGRAPGLYVNGQSVDKWVSEITSYPAGDSQQ